jgi:hypothetical protein
MDGHEGMLAKVFPSLKSVNTPDEKNLKSDESCISNPKSEIANWTV